MSDELALGQDSPPRPLTSSTECQAALLALTSQARRSLLIFSHRLDSKLYDGIEMYDAIRTLATSSRYADVRILVRDTQSLIQQGSRLLQLSQRISSRMQIRVPPVEFQTRNEEFCLIDERGLMYLPNASRYQGEIETNAALRGRQLKQFFDDCWEKSSTPSDLKRLHL